MLPPVDLRAPERPETRDRADNRALERRGLALGGVAGAGLAGLALWWRAAHPPLQPELVEAEALVEAYRAGRRPASPPARPAAGARLEPSVQPVAGGALVVLRVSR